MDKRKRFKLTLEIFRDILKICPRVHGQDFDVLPTDEDIVSFLRELRHTGEINLLNDVIIDQMHQSWRTFDETFSWRNKIRMYTSKDDFLINTLRFVSVKEATQIYDAILSESLTKPEMKENKAYKTYLSFAIGGTPPNITMKFKKSSPSKKDLNLNLVPVDEEPKSAKKKVLAKKTTRKHTSGVIIRDTPMESSSKRKEKVDVARGKGIELLSEVALTKDDQYE
nr:hypothetical protein [Tanacetum cinerariifolium]GFA39555.1 hypothetical protein [Tanacetum cinerariifolium]